MKTELERAAHYLDEALISLSAGRADAACVHMHHAATILDVAAAAASQPTEASVEEEAPKAMAIAA
jgi:hypothetical protein